MAAGLRLVGFFLICLTSSVPAIARPFEDTVPGLYTADLGAEGDLRLILYPVNPGEYKGEMFLLGKSYDVVAILDGNYVFGAYVYEGLDAYFSFPVSSATTINLQLGIDVLELSKQDLPRLTGGFEGNFGSFFIEKTHKGFEVVLTRQGRNEDFAVEQSGLKLISENAEFKLSYELAENTYVIETGNVFDTAKPLSYAESLALSPSVDKCDNLAGSGLHPDLKTTKQLDIRPIQKIVYFNYTSHFNLYVEMEPNDADQAISACRIAVLNYPATPRLRGNLAHALYTQALSDNSRYERAFAVAQKASENDVFALHLEALMYMHGHGTKRSKSIGFEKFQKPPQPVLLLQFFFWQRHTAEELGSDLTRNTR